MHGITTFYLFGPAKRAKVTNGVCPGYILAITKTIATIFFAGSKKKWTHYDKVDDDFFHIFFILNMNKLFVAVNPTDLSKILSACRAWFH